jgi:hypothetical protein
LCPADLRLFRFSALNAASLLVSVPSVLVLFGPWPALPPFESPSSASAWDSSFPSHSNDSFEYYPVICNISIANQIIICYACVCSSAIHLYPRPSFCALVQVLPISLCPVTHLYLLSLFGPLGSSASACPIFRSSGCRLAAPNSQVPHNCRRMNTCIKTAEGRGILLPSQIPLPRSPFARNSRFHPVPAPAYPSRIRPIGGGKLL